MRILSAITLLGLLGIAACTADPRTSSTPMVPPSAGGSAASPQSPNSLPVGGVVNAPRTPATGNVNTTVPGRTY